jgi:hypothetical protein
MGYHTFSEELLLIMTATFVNIAYFFNKTPFELAEGVNFPVSSTCLQLKFGFVSKFFKKMKRKCLLLTLKQFRTM